MRTEQELIAHGFRPLSVWIKQKKEIAKKLGKPIDRPAPAAPPVVVTETPAAPAERIGGTPHGETDPSDAEKLLGRRSPLRKK